MLGLRDLVVVAPATTSSMAEPMFPNPHQASSATATALGIGIGAFPLLATQPSGTAAAEGNRSKAHQAFGGGDPGAPSSISSSSSAIACRDCGNKAKKDCKYRRCRTCCKSRGYDCSTHVKSTWVPAARRRERQMMVSGAAVNAAGGGGGSSGSSTADGKRPRLAVGSSNTTASTKSYDTISSQQGVGSKDRLPGQVRAPAVFRCVRMTAVDEGGTDEIAYQAMVKIGGHMFKGLLCDQGVDDKDKDACILEVQLDSVSNCERNQRESYSSPLRPGHSRAFVTSSNCGLVAGNAAAYNDHPVN